MGAGPRLFFLSHFDCTRRVSFSLRLWRMGTAPSDRDSYPTSASAGFHPSLFCWGGFHLPPVSVTKTGAFKPSGEIIGPNGHRVNRDDSSVDSGQWMVVSNAAWLNAEC